MADASRIARATANTDVGVSRLQAARIELATMLRDVADDIEAGVRVMHEASTYEKVTKGEQAISVLHLVTTIKQPKENA